MNCLHVYSPVSIVDSRLFSPDEANAQGGSAALTAGKGSKAFIGGESGAFSIRIVHYRIRILPAQDVHGFDARSPQIAAEGKLPLQPEIQAAIRGETQGIRLADELLLEINGAEGIARPILEEITQLRFPDVRGHPAPREKAIRCVPGHWPWLLCRVENRSQRRTEHLVRMRNGAGVCAIELSAI